MMNDNDLISRWKMLEALGHFNDYVNGDPHFLNGIETAKEITENLPAVDAVPVVRCRDCKHRIVNENAGKKGYMALEAMCGLDTDDIFELGRNAEDPDWFCADGERRGDT